MEGPSFYCAYLGFSPVSKPPTNISILQTPVKELYLKYRKTPSSGPSANLKIVQKGVLVVLFEDGAVRAELFFDFSSVVFVEAARFSHVKSSGEKKPKALFVNVDESKGIISDKHSFPLDKSFQFLISSTHPPLVVCVVRRPTGVKALDCHVFALDTIENALHITALIGSTQIPHGHLIKSDSGGDISRMKGGFDRGARGDVIRTDRGDYSVYRGPPMYDTPPVQRYNGGPMPDAPQWYSGGLVRNGHVAQTAGWGPAPIVLTQETFRPSLPASHPPYSAGPGPRVYPHHYDHPSYEALPVNVHLRQTDVLVHAHQRPLDNRPPHFMGPPDPRQRYEDPNSHIKNRLQLGPLNDGRVPAAQVSAGPNRFPNAQVPPPGGRTPLLSPDAAPPNFFRPSHWQSDPSMIPPPPSTSALPPRILSPTAPKGFDARDVRGPVYSASNVESRGQGTASEPEEHTSGGKPVAKVPPHMKGIKVLPSDFRMVKLKPKSEKPPDAQEEEGYDNDTELMQKYKELQEQEKDSGYSGGIKRSTSRDSEGFRDFDSNKIHQDERGRDFMSQWNASVKQYKSSGVAGNDNSAESSKNPHRYSGPSQQHDDVNNSQVNGGPQTRTKDMEIESMFTNFSLHSSGNNAYRQPGGRSEIEEGLGYLP